MRSLLLAAFLVTACGDNLKLAPDANHGHPDAHIDIDASNVIPDGIAEARATADGTGLALTIHHVTITYLKPGGIGTVGNGDVAGFTIQASQMGPALFVAVDPTTLTPVPAVGDVVDFTITALDTNGGLKRVAALSDFAQVSQGAPLGPLTQDVSAATDLVSGLDSYESELVTVTGTLASTATSSGSGFQKFTLTTAGVSGDTNLLLRVPTTLVGAIDMTMGCNVVATRIPVGRFNAAVELSPYVASDLVMTGCVAPTVVSALALSATTVRVTFTRNIDTASVMANGSQFTFDNGLTASAVSVSGKTATVTTSTQVAATTYALTVATSVTDLQHTAIGTPGGATFPAFVQQATVRINEFNANITGGCDLIELRVTGDGAMTGYKVTERSGNVGNGELSFTFPVFSVHKNDIIVLHMNSASTVCDPAGLGTQELLTPTDQPFATVATNYDTAFDFYATDTGLVATDNVLTLLDATGTIIDAVFATSDTTATSAAAGTITGANAAGTANQWSPASTAYTGTTFTAAAVDDLNATGANALAGSTSIQRVDDTDDNDKADWTSGAGVAHTFGLKNVGQSTL